MIELLQGVVLEAAPFTSAARESLEKLLTFGGRASLALRLPSLAPFDRAIFERAKDLPSLAAGPRAGFENLVVYYNALGRLHLRPERHALLDYGIGEPFAIGYLALPAGMLREAEADAEARRADDLIHRARLDAALESQDLAALLDEVEDSVRHVEAICFYVDDCLYSVMERTTNLSTTRKGPGLFDTLRATKPAAWRPSDRLAVAALRALFLSGRSVRFEEFNSTELTAKALFDLLHRLEGAYAKAHGVPPEATDDPFALGRRIGRLAAGVDGENWLRYREVNGITFQKCERIVPLSEDRKLALDAAAAFRSIRDRRPKGPNEPRAFFARAADDAISALCREPDAQGAAALAGATTDLERLIEDIVGSAVLAVQADYGMSSSLRRPGELIVAGEAAFAERVDALTTKDFYCCIVGSARLRQRFGARLATDVFRAVQARMQFNRWHFVPGNLPRDLVSRDRHYFYPPVTPDISEWVDQFHGGHSRAGVRYSIRAPGPEILEPPLDINGYAFRGFYDVRVVRVDGTPFTLHDLALVREHSRWMGIVWRRILARCADATVRSRLAVRGFTNGCGAILEPAEIAAAE